MRCENCNGQGQACYDDGTVWKKCGHCSGTGNEPEEENVTENEIQDTAMSAAQNAISAIPKHLPMRVRMGIYNIVRADVELQLRDYEEGVL